MQTTEVKKAIKEVKGLLWGTFSILFATSCITVSLTRLISFPAAPEFRDGLVVFYSMPTTISSAVVLTQQVTKLKPI